MEDGRAQGFGTKTLCRGVMEGASVGIDIGCAQGAGRSESVAVFSSNMVSVPVPQNEAINEVRVWHSNGQLERLREGSFSLIVCRGMVEDATVGHGFACYIGG